MRKALKLAALVTLLMAGVGWHTAASAALSRTGEETVIEPPPRKARTYAHLPRGDDLDAMVWHLGRKGENAVPGDHRYILTVMVGTPGVPGDVAYFFNSPFSGSPWMWILEEYAETREGLAVRYWTFFADKVTTYDRTLDNSVRSSPTTFVVPGHSLWETAVGKSRRAWELLCGKYSCTLPFPP